MSAHLLCPIPYYSKIIVKQAMNGQTQSSLKFRKLATKKQLKTQGSFHFMYTCNWNVFQLFQNSRSLSHNNHEMLLSSHIPLTTTLIHKRNFTKTLHEKMLEVVPREQDRISKIFGATKDKELSK